MRSGPNIDLGGPIPDGWPREFKVSVWYVREDGHWSALVSEFNVVGLGESKDEAHENLRDNVRAYLASYIEEGADFEDARRPIPRKEALRLSLISFLMRLARAVTPKNRRGDVGSRSPRTVEHSGDIMSPIAC